MKNYHIPRSISTELKISKWLYLTDLFILLGFLLFRQLTVHFVSNSLVFLYTLFLIVLAIFLITRPSGNNGKRMYQAIFFSVMRKKDTYVAIEKEKKESE